MFAQLRYWADRAAQDAIKAVAKNIVETGATDPLTDDVYRAAERVCDAVRELEVAAAAVTQRDDPEAPEPYAAWVAQEGWSESELRESFGR